MMQEILDQKKNSLKKIGVNLKADRKVIEDEEDSMNSDDHMKYKASMQQEKVD